MTRLEFNDSSQAIASDFDGTMTDSDFSQPAIERLGFSDADRI